MVVILQKMYDVFELIKIASYVSVDTVMSRRVDDVEASLCVFDGQRYLESMAEKSQRQCLIRRQTRNVKYYKALSCVIGLLPR